MTHDPFLTLDTYAHLRKNRSGQKSRAVAAALAEGVRARGGELWLLLDELQAPLVASTPAQGDRFTLQLKALVEQCAGAARVVGTGSGMVSLLAAMRGAPVNGFALWDVVTHVGLGREPSAPAALAMAARIVAAHSAAWPAALAAAATPQRLVAALARGAHGELTSPRPALLSFLAGSILTDTLDAPEAALARALRARGAPASAQ